MNFGGKIPMNIKELLHTFYWEFQMICTSIKANGKANVKAIWRFEEQHRDLLDPSSKYCKEINKKEDYTGKLIKYK